LLVERGISGAVFHWYSGPLTLVDEIVSAGHYFSINPAMVRSKKGRQLVERIPKNRALTESDGPHLLMGRRPAEPADVTHVLRYLAQTWSASHQEAERQVRANLDDIIEPIRQWKRTSR
jgi:TatD DNase family protein